MYTCLVNGFGWLDSLKTEKEGMLTIMAVRSAQTATCHAYVYITYIHKLLQIWKYVCFSSHDICNCSTHTFFFIVSNLKATILIWNLFLCSEREFAFSGSKFVEGSAQGYGHLSCLSRMYRLAWFIAQLEDGDSFFAFQNWRNWC